jgi:hypothetical protein
VVLRERPRSSATETPNETLSAGLAPPVAPGRTPVSEILPVMVGGSRESPWERAREGHVSRSPVVCRSAAGHEGRKRVSRAAGDPSLGYSGAEACRRHRFLTWIHRLTLSDLFGIVFGVVDHGVWCGRANTAGLPSFSTEVSPVGAGGGGFLCWSGSVWWGVGGGEQVGEGVLVRPVGGQVEGDVAGSPGDPGGHGDQLTAQGTGACFGVKQAG